MAKLLINIKNAEEISLFSLADGYIINVEGFAMPSPSDVPLSKVDELIQLIKQKEVFLNINRMFTNAELDFLKDFVAQYKNKIKAFMFADFALTQLVELKQLFYFSPTQVVNSRDFDVLKKMGFYNVVASPYTILDSLKLMKNGAMIVHGHLSMYYSKRQLLTWYNQFYQSDVSSSNLFLKEKMRDEFYPFYQGKADSQIFTSTIFCSIDYLDQLGCFDYFIIDSTFFTCSYCVDILDKYQRALKGEKVSIPSHSPMFLIAKTRREKND